MSDQQKDKIYLFTDEELKLIGLTREECYALADEILIENFCNNHEVRQKLLEEAYAQLSMIVDEEGL